MKCGYEVELGISFKMKCGRGGEDDIIGSIVTRRLMVSWNLLCNSHHGKCYLPQWNTSKKEADN